MSRTVTVVAAAMFVGLVVAANWLTETFHLVSIEWEWEVGV